MTTTVYVPKDASALSLGADEVAHAIAAEAKRRGLAVQLVRNGSRGAFWLEPLVEVASARGRMAYGPVTRRRMSRDCSTRTSCTAAPTRCALGPTEEIPWFKGQQRLTFARVGIVDPASVADYVRHGGYEGLTRALTMEPAAIVQTVTASGLRGRGGAAFPTGIKWKTVLDQPARRRSTSPATPMRATRAPSPTAC